MSWETVAAAYEQRITALAARTPRLAGPLHPEPFPLTEAVEVRILATPAWRGEDELGELLARWGELTDSTTSACLYLLADPSVDGEPAELEARVLAAAAASGADIESCGDINVLMERAVPERDRRLHAAMDAYVPLHGAGAGHERMARAAGNAIVAPRRDELAAALGPARGLAGSRS